MKAIKDQARRGFSILVVVMLLTTVMVPAFSGSAVAATDGDHCTETVITQLVGSVCEWQSDADTVNSSESREDAYVQSDHHAELRGEYASAEHIRTIYDNYAQDTSTMASLEARNAIVTAYSNNETASTADTKAQSAIQDYYSIKEINTLEAYSKQQAQIAYTARMMQNHSGTLYPFVYPQTSSASNYNKHYVRYTGNLVNRTYTLSNGTSYTYKAAEFEMEYQFDSASAADYYKGSIPIEGYMNSSTWKEDPGNSGEYVTFNGLHNVRASYAGTNYSISNGHPAQVILDIDSWGDTQYKWQSQSDTMESNYAAGTASDIYAELDAGRLDKDDVRGAEGQVRYLSGDSNATEQRWKAALFGTLNMEQAGFNSTFYVEYTGYTEATYNRTTDGNKTVNYTGHVENQTYQGMIFSSEVPSGGFQPGNTYDTSKLNGTTMIYSQNSGTVTFVKGNLTISKVTDADGNKQDSVTWSDPKYDTNNMDEYIQYLNKTQEMQLRLLEKYEDDTSSGSTTTTESSGWDPSQNQLIALVVMLIAVLGMASRGAE